MEEVFWPSSVDSEGVGEEMFSNCEHLQILFNPFFSYHNNNMNK